jgi:hypothetical protein
MYTQKDIQKAFVLWALTNFMELPTLQKVRETSDAELADLQLANRIYDFLNKKGG